MGQKGVWGARHTPTQHPPLAPSSYDISQPAGRHLPYSYNQPHESNVLLTSLVKALSAAAATAAAAASTDKFEVTAPAAAAPPWSLRLQTLCQTIRRLGHRRRSAVEEADRRGRPLADPEPTANPDSQMLTRRLCH